MLEERDWEADSDARTLAQADSIRKDEQRLHKATAAAVHLAKESKNEAASMSKIANQEMFAKSARDLGINVDAKQTT